MWIIMDFVNYGNLVRFNGITQQKNNKTSRVAVNSRLRGFAATFQLCFKKQ